MGWTVTALYLSLAFTAIICSPITDSATIIAPTGDSAMVGNTFGLIQERMPLPGHNILGVIPLPGCEGITLVGGDAVLYPQGYDHERCGSSGDGPSRNGPKRNGPKRNGPKRNGPKRSGPKRKSSKRDDPRDGPKGNSPFGGDPFKDFFPEDNVISGPDPFINPQERQTGELVVRMSGRNIFGKIPLPGCEGITLVGGDAVSYPPGYDRERCGSNGDGTSGPSGFTSVGNDPFGYDPLRDDRFRGDPFPSNNPRRLPDFIKLRGRLSTNPALFNPFRRKVEPIRSADRNDDFFGDF